MVAGLASAYTRHSQGACQCGAFDGAASDRDSGLQAAHTRVPFVVVVARPDSDPRLGNIRVFVTTGQQGVNYRRETWHHLLIAVRRITDFLVVDRGDADGNYHEIRLDDAEIYVTLPHEMIAES
jgi:hypothetical protein